MSQEKIWEDFRKAVKRYHDHPTLENKAKAEKAREEMEEAFDEK